MNDIELNDWVKCFNTTGKLPSKQVQCSKCTAPVTMWSTNLMNRLKLFKDIKDLLSNFMCRDCSNTRKVKVGKKVQEVKPLIITPIIQEVDQPVKVIKVQEINSEGSRGGHADSVLIDLVTNAEYCMKHTREGGCWRPDIFLNNDRSCDTCRLYENCRATCRRLSHEKKRKYNEIDN